LEITSESKQIPPIEIVKPIFIIGAPRSGTTLLYQLLSQHPSLGWFSKNTLKKFLTDKFFRFLTLRRRIYGLLSLPYDTSVYTEHFFSTNDYLVEAGQLWEETFKKDWDVIISEENLDILKNTIVETLKEQKRIRFLSKVPKNSIRISTINKCFSNPQFIHIIRDGRVVVNSMLKKSVDEPYDYFGIPLKRPINPELTKIEKHTLQWIQVIQEIRKASKKLDETQYLELKYEELIHNPKKIMKKITNFCELTPFRFWYTNESLLQKIIMKIYSLTKSNKNVVKINEYRNIPHDNDFEIEKMSSDLLKELNYIET